MIIQLNTDNNIQGTAELEAFVKDKIDASLKHYANHITRIEVHLSDQNAHKGGKDDIQCRIETRISGKQPVSVVSRSDAKEKALDEAASKMKASLATILGKLKGR